MTVNLWETTPRPQHSLTDSDLNFGGRGVNNKPFYHKKEKQERVENSTECLHYSNSSLGHKAHLCPLWPFAQSNGPGPPPPNTHTHLHTFLWGGLHVHTQTTSAAFADLASRSCRAVAVSLNLLFSPRSWRQHKQKTWSQCSWG